MKRTTKITIETELVFVIRRPRASGQASCEACSEVVHLVKVGGRARAPGQRAIYRMIEVEQLHFIEAAQDLLVCFKWRQRKEQLKQVRRKS